MDDQRKDHIDQKGPKQRNRSKQLPTQYLPIDDVENINSTNKERDLLLAKKKECRKGSRGTAELLYIAQYILNESKTRWKNLSMACWILCRL